jgi:hypothetical protein
MNLRLCSRKPEYGRETFYIASQKDVKNSAIGWKSDVETFRMNKGDFGTIPRRAQQ